MAVTTCTDEGSVMLDWVTGAAADAEDDPPPAQAAKANSTAKPPSETTVFVKTELRSFMGG
ncbi:MAG TPA: hypothetical protein VE029_08220, partial [Rhizobacter sp.]|nr:hypothetical protein [Rhizobacter sp.]